MKSAEKTKLKKLIVAVAPSAARTIGLPNTQRTPATTWPLPGASGARFLGVDASEEEGRDDVGARVDDERRGRRDGLHEQAADARSGDVRKSAAPVHDRPALDQALAWHERDVDRHVRDLEEDAQRADQERDDEHVRERERVERVGERQRAEQGGPAEVGGDHDVPLPLAPVGPGPRVERQEEVRCELCGDEVSHLGGARVEGQDGDERQGDHADLIAEQRDRLAEPETAELRVLAQEGRHHHAGGL